MVENKQRDDVKIGTELTFTNKPIGAGLRVDEWEDMNSGNAEVRSKVDEAIHMDAKTSLWDVWPKWMDKVQSSKERSGKISENHTFKILPPKKELIRGGKWEDIQVQDSSEGKFVVPEMVKWEYEIESVEEGVKDTWWWQMDVDPGVVETTIQPTPLKELIGGVSSLIVREDIFEAAKATGLNPHNRKGGGQINVDLAVSGIDRHNAIQLIADEHINTARENRALDNDGRQRNAAHINDSRVDLEKLKGMGWVYTIKEIDDQSLLEDASNKIRSGINGILKQKPENIKKLTKKVTQDSNITKFGEDPVLAWLLLQVAGLVAQYPTYPRLLKDQGDPEKPVSPENNSWAENYRRMTVADITHINSERMLGDRNRILHYQHVNLEHLARQDETSRLEFRSYSAQKNIEDIDQDSRETLKAIELIGAM